MKHYLINPLWRCQNQCSYCWVQQTVRQRPELYDVPERPMADWVAAIQRDAPDIVDIAGGEPLLLDWTIDLITACPDTAFGLSTNGLAFAQIERLCAIKPQNLLAINISYHPEGKERNAGYDRQWKRTITLMRSLGAKPHTNIVNAPGNVKKAGEVLIWLEKQGCKWEISPYERMDVLGDKLPQGLCCQGGVNHLTIAPDGMAWPCLTALRSPYWKELALGNWLDGTIDLSRKPQPCHLNCVDYYVLPQEHEAGDMWNTQARPCEAAQ